MGNQTSRIIEAKHGSRSLLRKKRRKSNVSSIARSQNSSSLKSEALSEPLDEKHEVYPHHSAGAIDAAVAAVKNFSPSTLSVPDSESLPDSPISSPAQIDISMAALSDLERRDYERYHKLHYLLKTMRHKNFGATLDSPAIIVDVGTGNGIWAMETASEYPYAKVYAMDMRPPPQQAHNPENLRFLEADIFLSPWPLKDNSCDYVHLRHMGPTLKPFDWPILFSEVKRILKPGGLFEIVESNPGVMNAGELYNQMLNGYLTKDKIINYDLDMEKNIAMALDQLGFHHVDKHVIDIPLGEWHTDPELKHIGFLNMEAMKIFARVYRDYFKMSWSVTDQSYDLNSKLIFAEYEQHHSFIRYYNWIVSK